MLTALKVIAVLVLLGSLIVAGAVFWFIRFIRRAVKDALDVPSCPPCRVNPEPEPSPQWRSPALIAQYGGELRALGFEDVGAFQIPEMGGLLMLGLVHPAERLVGVVYDHKKIDPTCDICCDFEDGTGLSATNSSSGDTLDKRPGHPILWLGKNNAREVLDAVQKHSAPAPRKPIEREGFVAHFKKSYAEGMNWRLKKGGSSREEIRRHAEKKGQQLDKDQLEECYSSLRAAYVVELQAGCIAQYLDEQRTPAVEWERVRERTFAIPETLEPQEVVEAIANATDLDDEQRYQLDKVEKVFGETALNVLDKILAQNIGALGLQKLGEVTEPVGAYILLAPAASVPAGAAD